MAKADGPLGRWAAGPSVANPEGASVTRAGSMADAIRTIRVTEVY